MKQWIIGLLVVVSLSTIQVERHGVHVDMYSSGNTDSSRVETLPLSAEVPVFAEAKRRGIPLIFQRGEWLSKLAEFPDTEPFELSEKVGSKTHFDLGWSFSGIKVLLLPIAHWDGKHIGYIDDDNAVTLSKEDVEGACQLAGISMPEGSAGFWWDWGGKLVILALILGVGYLAYQRRVAAEKAAKREQQREARRDRGDRPRRSRRRS